ncbi:uncharacterized protein LOC144629237 [Oculina patagonica]
MFQNNRTHAENSLSTSEIRSIYKENALHVSKRTICEEEFSTMKIAVVLCFAFLMVCATHGTRRERNECELREANCLQGGTCVLHSRPDGTTRPGCSCVHQWTGTRCEIRRSPAIMQGGMPFGR